MSFLAKLMKKNVWLGPLLFIKTLLLSAQLLSKHFPSGLSLLVSFILYFQGYFGNFSAMRSACCVCFPISYCFHKCFNNFHLSKNFLINKFFSLKLVFLYSFTSMTQGSCEFLLEVK